MEAALSTPDRVVYKSTQIESCKLLADQGEIEILPRHTNYIAVLKAGAVALKLSGSSETKRFEVGDGIVKVEADKITILCSTASAAMV